MRGGIKPNFLRKLMVSYNQSYLNTKQFSHEAEICKIFTRNDVDDFIRLTLDTNPIHIGEYKNSRYSKAVVHGALINGLVSAVMGTKLPGPGTIVAKQSLNFSNPLYVGEMVCAKVTVTKSRKSVVKCSFSCVKDDGTVVLHGDAILINENYK